MPEARRLATMLGMRHDPRFDVLQAAIVALAAALHPDQASFARAALLAGVADLEDRPGGADEDAAAQPRRISPVAGR